MRVQFSIKLHQPLSGFPSPSPPNIPKALDSPERIRVILKKVEEAVQSPARAGRPEAIAPPIKRLSVDGKLYED